VTELDRLFAKVRAGNRAAFASWMEQVHLPVRASLRRFATAVDVEAVMQEALLRMWLVARESTRLLEGRNASLRFTIRVARNVALEELRRFRLEEPTAEPETDAAVAPDPLPDPALRRLILECLDRLPSRPRTALRARLADGHRRPDAEIAERIGMRKNTYLQNISRARPLMEKCLDDHGVRLEEVHR
jgi:RNA polymerase sigma-70 factor (ECF subfamily)